MSSLRTIALSALLTVVLCAALDTTSAGNGLRAAVAAQASVAGPLGAALGGASGGKPADRGADVPAERANCYGDATNLLYPFSDDGSWTQALPPNDDGSYGPVALPFTFSLYGDEYTECWINNNGNVSFVGPYAAYSPVGFPSSAYVMVAPFWGDVDTRRQDVGTGTVWYKFIGDHTLVVTWDNVGYYSRHTDKLNTFQVAISNGGNPDMGAGTTVCFSYDEMCWTTGDASGGSGGFGGYPATVGCNRGDGIDYFLVGRFDHAGDDYDGPLGSADGIDYLDGQLICVNTADVNIPPIPVDFPPNNEVTVAWPDTLALEVGFISPEDGQTTTVYVEDPHDAQAAGLTYTSTPGNPAFVAFSWTPPCPAAGSYTLVLTAIDDAQPAGTTEVELTIHVECDNEPPACDAGGPYEALCVAGTTLEVPLDGSGSADPDQDGLTYEWTTDCPGAMFVPDNTVPAPVLHLPDPAVRSCEVTLSVSDGIWPPVVCSQTVTVFDDVPPTITTCPPARSIPARGGACRASVPDLTSEVVAGDACSPTVTVLQSPAAGTDLPLGLTVVGILVSDGEDNVATCTVDVTVVDEEAPTVLSCPPAVGLEADQNCQAVLPDLTDQISATDNCDGDLTITQQPAAGSTLPLGMTDVAFLVADDAGNTADCTVPVVVEDHVAPEIQQCPPERALSADPNCQAVLPDLVPELVAMDNCPGVLEVTQTPPAGATLGLGATTVTLRVVDAHGNSATCDVAVTVVDDEPPVITQCATGQVIGVPACEGSMPDLTGHVLGADNCDDQLTITQSPAPGSPISVQPALTVEFEVSDAAGNVATCVAEIPVNDDTPPSCVEVTPAGLLTEPPDAFEVEFSEAMRPETFTVDDILMVPPAGQIEVGPPEPLSPTRFRVPITATAEGLYVVLIGTGIEDECGGHPLVTGCIGEWTLDTTPPTIISHAPDGEWPGVIEHFDLTFNEPVTADGCSPDDFLLTTPSMDVVAAEDIVQLGDSVFWRVIVPRQEVPGDYTLLVPPCFTDLAGFTMTEEYVAAVTIALPDLTGVMVSAPPTSSPGATIQLTWEVSNIGDATANAPWFDWVLLSDDAQLGDDIALHSHISLESLAPDTSREVQVDVTVPATGDGAYWLLVALDSVDNVLEDDEQNNLIAWPLELERSDLVVSDAVVPGQATSGATITVDWIVANSGAGEAIGPWQDCVYLSDDSVVGDDTLLLCVERADALPAESTYDVETDVALPPVAEGDYWLVFTADADGDVSETEELNNDLIVGPITISRPNLAVVDGSGPAEVIGGQSIDVSWTVLNDGAAAATAAWSDCVYLSDDDQWGDDVQLSCLNRPVPLDPNASYERSATMTVPIVAEGTYRLLAVADAEDRLPEPDEMDNVFVVGTIEVFAPACPDLAASDVLAPVNAATGGTIQVDWLVTNVGTGPTDAPLWYDYVYLSRDQQLGGGDIRLSPNVRNASYLNAGESYLQSAAFNTPGGAVGAYYVIVVADGSHHVSECTPGDGNNTAVAPEPTYFDPVPQGDLIVPHVDASPTAPWSGDTITVEWTGQNAGLGDIAAGAQWQDRVFLSGDFEGQAVWHALGSVAVSGPLAPNESYTRALTVSLPAQYHGVFEICVVADAGGHVGESEEGNNDGCGGPVDIQMVPPADLELTSVLLLPTGTSGQAHEVTWTVANMSAEATWVSSWHDRIVLSVDDDPATTDDNVVLGTYRHDGALGGDDSYTRTETVMLPHDADGAYYVCVMTDVNNVVYEWEWEDNNSDCRALAVTYAPPDLQLAACLVTPLDPSVADTIHVEWSVMNVGSGPVPAQSWTDRVYLSADAVVDAGDTPLGTFSVSGPLAPGESYLRTAVVDLPGSVTDGPYHVLVRTNANGAVHEASAADNDCATETLSILRADLRALRCDVFSGGSPIGTVSAGVVITIEWAADNAGPGHALIGWSDTAYLSADATWDPGVDIPLGSMNGTAPLLVGDSYLRTRSVALPINVSGTGYRVIVGIDRDDAVAEEDEGNNTIVSEPFDIIVPDLRIAQCGATVDGTPLQFVTPGEQVAVQWSVTNHGPGAVLSGDWTDRIYLSSDEQHDGGDELLAGRVQDGPLVAGGQYTVERVIDMPVLDGAGPFYLIVVADAAHDVPEGEAEGNNTCVYGPFGVEPPNLTLQACAVTAGGVPPETVLAGSVLDVSWTVANTGDGAALLTPWRDRIYLSADDVWDGQDTALALHTRNTPLGVGESYTPSRSVALPAGFVSDAVYLLVRVDADADIDEIDELDNGCAFGPFAVVWGAPDFRVTTVSATQGDPPGEVLHISWTVRNDGGLAEAAAWNDAVYLSVDRWLDPNDYHVGTFSRAGPLGHSQSYARNEVFNVPPALFGDFYVIVRTDVDDDVAETNEDNNEKASAYAAGANTCESDLVVSEVDAAAEAISGQTLTLAWTVNNVGAGPTHATAWNDAIYLSRDQFLDLGVDLYAGYIRHDGALAAGASYTTQTDLALPSGASGRYYVFIVADSGGAACESDESNNVGYDADSVEVLLLPPADLVVDAVVVPLGGMPGDPVTIEWQVRNAGDNTASGSWHDAVYLSADTVWDIHDAKLGTRRHTGAIGTGDTYTTALTAPLPGLVPGDYYAIVRTDIYNEVREAIGGEDNNLLVSDAQLAAELPELELGVPHEANLAGGAHYYRVTAPAGETLRVLLDCHADEGANELYIRYEAVPDRSHYDFAYTDLFAPDQEVLVPTSQAGTYYILVYGDVVPNAPQAYTILAEAIPFGITAIEPGAASNFGPVTVTVTGARFDPAVELSLFGTAGSAVLSDPTYWVDSSRTFATFNLVGQAVGPADMRAVNPGGGVAVAEGVFEIIDGGGPQLMARVVAPSFIREGREFTVTVEYVNIGTVDLPAPLLSLGNNRNVGMRLSGDQPYRSGALQMLGINPDGPAGVLPPGAADEIVVYVAAAPAGRMRFQLHWLTGKSPIDWDAIEDTVRPANVPPEQWAQIWNRLRAHVGGSLGDYGEALARNATRLWQRGERVYDSRSLFAFELRNAWLGYPSLISGIAFDGETGAPLADTLVGARSDDGLTIRHAVTDEFGYFEHTVPAGAYELVVAERAVEPRAEVVAGYDEDVVGLELATYPLPTSGPPAEPADVPDADPALMRDAGGDVHMVFRRGGELWHARHDGSEWAVSGAIGAATGDDARIAPAPAAAGADSVVVAWQTGVDNEAEIEYVLGQPADGARSYTWTAPSAVTTDTYADHKPALVLTNAGQLMVVWLKKDAAITDDTDLYYDIIEPTLRSVPAVVPMRLEQASPLVLQPVSRDLPLGRDCVSIDIDPGMELSLPGLSGRWGFTLSGEFCADLVGCEWTGSASGTISLDLGDRVNGEGTLGGSLVYVVRDEACEWGLSSATATLNANADGEIPMGPIPNPLVGICPICGPPVIPGSEWGWTLHGGLNGTLRWTGPELSAWPNAGSATINVGGGPYGQIDFSDWHPLLAASARIDGTVDLTLTFFMPRDFEAVGCLTVTATFKCSLHEGTWSQTWCTNDEEPPPVPTRDIPADALVHRTEEVLADGTHVFNEVIIQVNPLVGTGNVYPGQTVLADVTQDVRNDGSAGLHTFAGGPTLCAWTKDSDDPNTALGSAVVVASHEGTWSSPTVVASDTHFNYDPQVGGTATEPLVVWSSADGSGLSLDNSAAEILEAAGATDVFFARRVNNVWTTPAALAALPGSDDLVAVASDAFGRVLAAWRNQPAGDGAQPAVYASLYDPNAQAWAPPAVLAMPAGVYSVACEFVGGAPLVVWSGDADGDVQGTPLDASIFHATYDGAAWSAPVALPKAPQQAPRVAAAGGRFVLPDPPEQCCDDEDDEDPPEDPNDPDIPDNDDPEDESDTDVIGSFDPNQKLGPAGYGEQRFIPVNQAVAYRVDFENLPDATAPAQQITVVDELDDDLDWRTFRLTEIAFGGTEVELPDSVAHFSDDILLDSGLIARISAGIDIRTGVVTWSLTAIDPETGEPPADPTVGLLPPNDPEVHDGEGHVTFTIRARDDVPTGTEASNRATITFDNNEPITTNDVFNLIDAVAPEATMVAPSGPLTTAEFDVTWTATDDEDGSGVVSHAVYYRLGDGPYTLWLTTGDTTAPFVAPQGGVAIDFYCVATDGAGNVGEPPLAPQTSVIAGPAVPDAIVLVEPTAATVRLADLGTANVPEVEYAVIEQVGGQYVGPTGRLQHEPFWQPLAAWGDMQVRALAAQATYSFAAAARTTADITTGFGPPAEVLTTRPGDVNGDDQVTYADLGLLRRALGTSFGDEMFDARADLNGDDRVTFVDLGIVRRNLAAE